MITGGCHCGAIRYQAEGEAITHALCHCTDCRRHAGAPMIGWTMYAQDAVKVTKGTPKVYASSEHGRRHFCADCGTGLFYVNTQMLPGIIDIQSATFDDPDAVPATLHIQTAERIGSQRRTRCRARRRRRGVGRRPVGCAASISHSRRWDFCRSCRSSSKSSRT